MLQDGNTVWLVTFYDRDADDTASAAYKTEVGESWGAAVELAGTEMDTEGATFYPSAAGYILQGDDTRVSIRPKDAQRAV